MVVAGQDFAFRSLSVTRLLGLAEGSWQPLLEPLPWPRASPLQKLVQIAAAPGTGVGITAVSGQLVVLVLVADCLGGAGWERAELSLPFNLSLAWSCSGL